MVRRFDCGPSLRGMRQKMRWQRGLVFVVVLVASVAIACVLPFVICALEAYQPANARSTPRIGVGPQSANKQVWAWSCSDGLGCSELLAQVVNESMARSYEIVPPPETGLKQPVLSTPPYWSIVSRQPTPPHVVVTQEERFPSLQEEAYGWPARSLSYRKEAFEERVFRAPGGSGKTEVEFEMSFDGAASAEVIPSWLFYHSNQWPTHIIWRGMIVNVLFFAAVLGSPWWIRALRRWWRARTGRCVRCGYSIAGLKSGKCPECGWAAPPPVASLS